MKHKSQGPEACTPLGGSVSQPIGLSVLVSIMLGLEYRFTYVLDLLAWLQQPQLHYTSDPRP